jgi:hypothetical protein
MDVGFDGKNYHQAQIDGAQPAASAPLPAQDQNSHDFG